MTWVVFENRRRYHANRKGLFVRITAKGHMYLSADCRDWFIKSGKERVLLLCDAENRAIALKPCELSEPNGYAITICRSNLALNIPAVIRKFGKSGEYGATINETEGILEIKFQPS